MFLGFYLVALIGNLYVDIQLEVFKNAKKAGTRKEPILKDGLWNYSRHPNYFFEMIVWISFAGTLISLTGYYFPIISVVTMWVIFRWITTPLTEKGSVKRKGELYREYQRKTPMIIPFFHWLNFESKNYQIIGKKLN